MAVTYSREMQEKAKEKGQHLVTLSVAGMEFQGHVTEEERNDLVRYYLAFTEKRRNRLQENAQSLAGPPGLGDQE